MGLNGWRRKLNEQKMNEENTVERNEGCTVHVKKIKWEPIRSADERAGKQVQIIEALRFGRGPGDRLYCTRFYLYR
jgi:hypothetical protein